MSLWFWILRFLIYIFRDLEEQKNAKFDMSMMNFPNKFEGPVEKKLRETGEWITNKTERGFRLSGNHFLCSLFLLKRDICHQRRMFKLLDDEDDTASTRTCWNFSIKQSNHSSFGKATLKLILFRKSTMVEPMIGVLLLWITKLTKP